MNPQRSTTVTAVIYPAVVIAGWAFVSLAGTGSHRIDNSAAAHVVDRLAPSLAANVDFTSTVRATAAVKPNAVSYAPTDIGAAKPAELAKPVVEAVPAAAAVPQAIAADSTAPDTLEVAAAAELAATPPAFAKPVIAAAAAPEPKPIVLASLGDPTEVLAPEAPYAPAPPDSTADAPREVAAATPDRIEIVGECLVVEPCIDQFLFALYQRTPKEDTIKEIEKRKVQVKRKGKMVTVTRSFTKLVENDFTWKDPHAAERVGMSMSDYVIGGMDRSFKLKLFRMLYAAEAAGLRPGITSAFRDDYRQGIASGLKAASNRSFHGGSLRGGYGRGLAADIVSVNGANRAQRWASTEIFWKWVDANGKQYGVGRPYLKFDPPHVGPTDGAEYVSRRGSAKTTVAEVKKRQKQVAQAKPAAAKRQLAAKPSNSERSGQLAEAR